MKTNPDEPAFPRAGAFSNSGDFTCEAPGMSIREAYAMAALPAHLSEMLPFARMGVGMDIQSAIKCAARDAVAAADALIEALNK